MDTMQTILSRRSIRKYTGEVVSQEEIQTILRAAMHAPTAMNLQPWHFVVMKKPEVLQAMADSHPYAKMLPKAGCGVVVCADITKQPQVGYAVEDCSAAIQNMLLAAKSMGLGTVWCGLYPMEARVTAVVSVLNLPENIVPVGLVVIGHGAEERTIPDRYEEYRVHFDRWE